LPVPAREDLPAAAQAAYDHIAKTRAAIPPSILVLLHSPEMARRVADLSDGVVNRSSIDEATRAIIGLTIAREVGCYYSWQAQEELAKRAGLRSLVVEGIRGRTTRGMLPKESVFVDYAKQVFNRRVNDPTFAAIEHLMGKQGAVDLTIAIGYFIMMFSMVEAFGIQPTAGYPAPFPKP
jgi:4-carboxymuconolactone decarboxylase